MSIKKKLGLGVASAALGISLVGGGTWAAFNDTAKINNAFAAGTLDVKVSANSESEPINIDLSNMKPGDSVERVFKLENIGSLAIKEVLLSASASGFDNGTGSNQSMDDFLDQFTIDFFKVDKENNKQDSVNVYSKDKHITLKQLVNGTFDFNAIKDVYEAEDGSKRINLAPLSNVVAESKRGIPAGGVDTDEVHVKITFKNDLTKLASGEYVQNKFMDNSVNFSFDLEATQWAGVEVQSTDANGKVNNGVQGSADDTTDPVTQPDPRTTGEGTIDANDVVVD
ncbi:spore coat protein [Bacillus sp. V3]|nr:spore coat protein [Bacillus sp. V3]